MSKGTTPRHSKPSEPVTIDLDATDVTPREEFVADAAPDRSDTEREDLSAATETEAEMETSAFPEAGDEEAAVRESEAPPSTPPHAAQTLGRDAEQVRSAGGFGPGSLLGGLGGGVLAFLALYGLQAGGLLPTPGNGSSKLAGEVVALQSAVDGLSKQVAEFPADGGAGALAAVTERLTALEQEVVAASDSGAGQALGELDARLSELGKRLDEVAAGRTEAAADPAALAGLRTRAEATDAAIAGIRAEVERVAAALAGLEQKQAAVTQSLGAVEAKVAEPDRDLDMARAIASSGLKTAIDRGGPFAAELEAFASVAPEDPAIAELRDLAATGVPTRARLVAAFPDAAEAMIAAMNPIPDGAGIVDRLIASARSVVRVRKVGEIEGDDVEAIAARIETRLTDGDLEAALGEWAKLPEPARAAAAGFGKDLAARARVEKMMRDALLPAAPGSEAPAAAEPAAPAAPANQEAPR
jgi:Uncharacterized protein conserved in bacteria